jgi:vacuolar-type H+-ATPase subunit E/Vma4
MAKLIPSGVVNLPNFAELQYNLNERERQKQLQFDEWSSQFDKKAGTYLDGDKEAVQTSYAEVEKALKELARDPDSVELRRKVREANASYNEVAGTARFLADNYRQQWSSWNSDPDKFGVSGQEAIDLFNRERSTKRDANQIMSLAANPFTLMPKYKYDMQAPTQVSKEYEDLFRKNINDYTKKDGSVDLDKAREFITNAIDARYIDPNQLKNSIIYSGVREGVIGRNGEITSRADLDVIDTEQFAPQRDRLANKFKDDVVNSFMAVIPKVAVNPAEMNLQQQKINLEYAKLNQKANEAQRGNKYFGIDPAPYTQRVGDKVIASGYMVPIDFAPVNTTRGNIVRFGKLNGKPQVILEVKEKSLDELGNEVTTIREVARPAKDSDLSLLRKATDGLSDEYFKILPSSQRLAGTSQNAVPSQSGSDPLGLGL